MCEGVEAGLPGTAKVRGSLLLWRMEPQTDEHRCRRSSSGQALSRLALPPPPAPRPRWAAAVFMRSRGEAITWVRVSAVTWTGTLQLGARVGSAGSFSACVPCFPGRSQVLPSGKASRNQLAWPQSLGRGRGPSLTARAA